MPSGPIRDQESVRFGVDFELDICARRLRRANRVLKLERIPLEILVLLVEHSGQLVTREEIVDRIWGKGVFLDTDNSIRGAIRKIRQVLKDDAEQPRFIQTVTRAGYRFIAPVIGPTEEAAVVAPKGPPGSEAAVDRAGRRHRPVPLAVAVGFAAIIGAWLLWSRLQPKHQSSSGRLMLAVLPFENLTGDAGQEYLSDGFTEEMITQLGHAAPQRVGVIARTSVMGYEATRQKLRDIGRELGVQYVLEGSVMRDSDKVRITAQLIEVKEGTDLWAREYDRQLQDLLVLQREIAQEIGDEVQHVLGYQPERSTSQPFHPPATYEAFDLYLRGRFFWNKRTPQGFRQATAWFQQAIEKDPQYARAYAGLADSYSMMSAYGLAPANDCMPKARAAALKALQIDDSLAEAHTSLALTAQNYDWDWQTAEKEYRRALELDPNYATAHHWYSESLAFQGRFDEALAESERARQLDPLSLIIAADNGAILYFSRQYDRAIERFRAVLDMDPAFTRAHLVIAAYVQKGQFKDALADIELWRSTAGDAPWIWAWEAYVYGRAGEPIKAQDAMAKLQQLNRSWQLDPAQFLGVAYAAKTDNDAWLAWLDSACRKHSNVLTDLKVDPMYDPLRGDPRFQALVHRVGLAE
jgi:TolB-like protein/DNA-binding winged helix-turn-helix (wHTH) protein/Tfp pilus assembly protein PilF